MNNAAYIFSMLGIQLENVYLNSKIAIVQWKPYIIIVKQYATIAKNVMHHSAPELC